MQSKEELWKRWDKEAITTMEGTPQKPNPDKVGLHIPTRIAPKPGELESGAAPGGVAPEENEGIPEAPPIPEPLTRRMPITHKEIEKYGYTEGCPGCDAKRRGEIARRGHSEKCRKRIEEKMKEDEEGRKKIDKSDERIAHKIAKDIEKAEHKRKADEEKTDQITKDDQDAEQEEQMKKRRREEEDHKTAASSGGHRP